MHFISISDYEGIKDVLRKISKDINVLDKEITLSLMTQKLSY